MIEKVSIQDNFLPKEEFDDLRDLIMHNESFPWFFGSNVVYMGEEQSVSPGQLVHWVYRYNVPASQYYETITSLPSILKNMEVDILLRIKLNLNLRLPQPYISSFHTDMALDAEAKEHFTTSILYINTNNGYTEIENTGERIKNVANRLVTFPLTTKHRGVTQTDEQTRVVMNFNYLKYGIKSQEE